MSAPSLLARAASVGQVALPPVSAAHPAARRYSLARRNQLPRGDRVVAIHGPWAHQQLMRLDRSPETLLWCPATPDEAAPHWLGELAGRAGSAYRISPRTLARLHPGARPPEVLSVVRLPECDVARVLRPGNWLLLVADGIEYAGNLGTLVRSVDASGADGLIVTSPVARVTHPKVFTASRGTVLTTPVVEVESVDAARTALIRAGFTVLVADPAAARPYGELNLRRRQVAVVVGSEGDGVCPGWLHPDVTRVRIPMHGLADSLNVAVAASILLFEAARGRGRGAGP